MSGGCSTSVRPLYRARFAGASSAARLKISDERFGRGRRCSIETEKGKLVVSKVAAVGCIFFFVVVVVVFVVSPSAVYVHPMLTGFRLCLSVALTCGSWKRLRSLSSDTSVVSASSLTCGTSALRRCVFVAGSPFDFS